ncbi:hypothetical protein NIHE141904_48390 [Enterobacter hormaechei]|nr:hypothetical protein NIHE141904_48390 [Enterobacter hormaechei]
MAYEDITNGLFLRRSFAMKTGKSRSSEFTKAVHKALSLAFRKI